MCHDVIRTRESVTARADAGDRVACQGTEAQAAKLFWPPPSNTKHACSQASHGVRARGSRFPFSLRQT
eukprot:3481450-Prymnesium_polylepis.1